MKDVQERRNKTNLRFISDRFNKYGARFYGPHDVELRQAKKDGWTSYSGYVDIPIVDATIGESYFVQTSVDKSVRRTNRSFVAAILMGFGYSKKGKKNAAYFWKLDTDCPMCDGGGTRITNCHRGSSEEPVYGHCGTCNDSGIITGKMFKVAKTGAYWCPEIGSGQNTMLIATEGSLDHVADTVNKKRSEFDHAMTIINKRKEKLEAELAELNASAKWYAEALETVKHI